jgi:hypothetical protein
MPDVAPPRYHLRESPGFPTRKPGVSHFERQPEDPFDAERALGIGQDTRLALAEHRAEGGPSRVGVARERPRPSRARSPPSRRFGELGEGAERLPFGPSAYPRASENVHASFERIGSSVRR